jgi:predicted permease
MLTRLIAYIRGFVRRDAIDAEVVEELRFHLDREIEANLARGLSPLDARRAALRDLGGLTQTREAVRDVRSIWLDALRRDVRHALRRLGRERGFAAAAIVTLTLGIGANTTAVTIIHGVLDRPLPGVRDAARLVLIRAEVPGHRGSLYNFDARQIEELGSNHDLITSAAASTDEVVDVTGPTGPVRLRAVMATPQFFQTLGTRLVRGRPFLNVVGQDETAPDAIISEVLWRDWFDRRDSAVGAHLIVNGVDVTIVGVAPKGFLGFRPLADDVGPGAPSLWLPSSIERVVTGNRVDFDADEVVARLQPGVSVADANRGLQILGERWAQAERGMWADAIRGITGVRLGTPDARFRFGEFILSYLAFPVVVLLIACANLAALMLARGVGRVHEVDVRRALGATTWQIVRERLVEAIVLSLLGGASGLLLSVFAAGWLVTHLPVARVSCAPDATIVGVTLLISLVSVVLFGLAPAIAGARPRAMTAATALRSSVGIGGPPKRARIQRGLVVLQIALSLMLLASGGVLVQAVRSQTSRNPGFEVSQSVLTASIDLDSHSYALDARRLFWDGLVERVRTLPGVETASLAEMPPYVRGVYYGRLDNTAHHVGYAFRVSPDYFKTLQLPFLRGRDFTTHDDPSGPPVAIVSDELARAMWPGEDAIGRTIPMNNSGATGHRAPVLLTVVGVVTDIRADRSLISMIPSFYVPLRQHQETSGFGWARASLLVRVHGDATLAIPLVQGVARKLDPNVSLFNVATVRALAERATQPQRVVSEAVTGLGLTALLLAVIGTFGSMAYAMAQRTREVGIRIALGARPVDVIRLGLREGGRLGAIGLPIGLVLGVAASRFVASRIVPGQPIAMTAVALVFLLVTIAVLAACYVPARRAARVDPVVVLKVE